MLLGQGFMIARTSTANGVFAPNTIGAPAFNNSQRAFRRDASSSIFKKAHQVAALEIPNRQTQDLQDLKFILAQP
jgi:hypothetical protein